MIRKNIIVDTIKIKGLDLIEKVHLLIFGHPMSDEMKMFIGNLSWSLFSGFFVMPILTIISILAGRFMGPLEYGKYSLMLVINQILVIFIFFGLDTTSVKYIAKAKNFNQKKQVISSSLLFFVSSVTIFILLTTISALLFYKSNLIFFEALIVYTVAICTKVMFDTFIRGLEEFKNQAKGKIIEVSSVILFFITAFVIFNETNFLSLVLTISFGAILSVIYFLYRIRKYIQKVDIKFLLKQLNESKVFFLSGLIATIFTSADKLIVGKYLGIEVLGIYSAYYASSIVIVSQVSQLVTNVFLPTSSRLKNKSFTKKIDRFMLFGFVPLAIIMSAIIITMLQIFGRGYPKYLTCIIGFSIFSSLYFFQSLYDTVIIDIKRKEYSKYILAKNTPFFLVMFIYLILIVFHKIALTYIISALIINMLLVIYIQRLYVKKMQSES